MGIPEDTQPTDAVTSPTLAAGTRHLPDGSLAAPAGSTSFIMQIYQDVLQRPADSIGLGGWETLLAHGVSRTDVALAITNSPEARANAVKALYGTLLHRLADAVGLSGFTALLAAGGTLEQVESMILASPEYYQTRGAANDTGFLAAVYHDAFNRQVDADGMAGWSAALVHGSSRAQVTDAILQSDEYRRDLVQSDYERFLGRDADQAGLAAFVAALAQGQRDEEMAAMFLGSDEYFAQLAH